MQPGVITASAVEQTRSGIVLLDLSQEWRKGRGPVYKPRRLRQRRLPALERTRESWHRKRRTVIVAALAANLLIATVSGGLGFAWSRGGDGTPPTIPRAAIYEVHFSADRPVRASVVFGGSADASGFGLRDVRDFLQIGLDLPKNETVRWRVELLVLPGVALSLVEPDVGLGTRTTTLVQDDETWTIEGQGTFDVWSFSGWTSGPSGGATMLDSLFSNLAAKVPSEATFPMVFPLRVRGPDVVQRRHGLVTVSAPGIDEGAGIQVSATGQPWRAVELASFKPRFLAKGATPTQTLFGPTPDFSNGQAWEWSGNIARSGFGFAAEELAELRRESNHAFWAGLALGLCAAAVLGAIQLWASLPPEPGSLPRRRPRG